MNFLEKSEAAIVVFCRGRWEGAVPNTIIEPLYSSLVLMFVGKATA